MQGHLAKDVLSRSERTEGDVRLVLGGNNDGYRVGVGPREQVVDLGIRSIEGNARPRRLTRECPLVAIADR
jgi:hypothetical protein